MSSSVTVPIRTKNADGKTITTYADGINCSACAGKGYYPWPAMPDVFETCKQCKGRGALVRDAKPMPQIEDW